MRYYIIAGEASGDLHGANLIKELLTADNEADIRFWGGARMVSVATRYGREGHIEQVRDIREMAFMGIVEVVSHLGSVLGNIRFCKQDIMDYKPDVVVGIDYPGFNLKIARFAHKKGIRYVHYISPQVWAWKKGRLRTMRKYFDSMCYILPMEKKYFEENAMPQAVYVGHPLMDEVKRYREEGKEVMQRGSDDRQIVALLPGSRKQELKKMLPEMVRLAEKHREFRFVIAGMSLIGSDFYEMLLPKGAPVEMVYDATYDLLAVSHAAVVCSGTATLETGLFRVPQVVCYQCNPISAAIARRLIASRIRYISLVNLIADRRIVSELIQDDFGFGRLDAEFERIATDEAVRERMKEGYDEVAEILGGEGASRRTAEEIIWVARNGRM